MILATVCVALHLLHMAALSHTLIVIMNIHSSYVTCHHIKPVSILHTVWSDSISNNSMFYVNCNCIIHGHIKVNLWLSFILIGQYLNYLQDSLFWWKGKCTIWLYSLIIQMMILVIKINFYNTLYCFLDRKN